MDRLATDGFGACNAATQTGAVSRPTDPFSSDTLAALFQRSATWHADRPALWVEGGCVSYRELNELAVRIAHGLMGAGYGDGQARCAILGNRGLIDFAGILGALLARCAYVPLNVRHPPQRLAHFMHEAEAQALVVDHKHLDHARFLLEAVPQPVLVLLPDTVAMPDWGASMARHRFLCRSDLSQTHTAGIRPGNAEEGAYLLFTSGSTGVPKGVLVRNRNVMPYLRSVAARYAPTPEDRCTQLFDLTFDLSVHDMFLCWGAGATLFRVPDNARFAPRDFVRRNALTMWFSVPSTAAMMLGLRALRPDDFPSLRLGLFCGEALPKRLAVAWAAAAPNAVIENLYGPTEATIALTAFRLPRDAKAMDALPEVVPIGAPLPEQDALPINPSGQPAADGEEGELCLAGSQVTDGYWRRADLTDQRFVRFNWDDRIWYRTGDRARHTREHGLVFLGRLDRQVKIAGHRVELQEVEAVLHQAADANAAAIAWPLGPDGLARGIVGFVGQTTRPIDDMLDACRRTLPPYAVPSAIHHVDDWPLNSSGKTDHARLRALMETPKCSKT
ncbi:MAG: amino acid adenylation domain-containing protein [Acetobacteraceae bacterium]